MELLKGIGRLITSTGKEVALPKKRELTGDGRLVPFFGIGSGCDDV